MVNVGKYTSPMDCVGMMDPGSGYFPSTKHLGVSWFQNDQTMKVR